MIRVSILGATGYAGAELVRLLLSHPQAKITHLVSHSNAGTPLCALYPSLVGYDLPVMEELDLDVVPRDSDIIFTALPHGASQPTIAQLHGLGCKVVDLSGDYRYDDPAVYEAWYGTTHEYKDVLARSVYGLPELHRDRIADAKLIGNPGCYTTCSILPLYPLVKAGLIDSDTIVVDAKSGSTGAGRGVSIGMHFCEVNENVKAYGVANHRHTSEIEQELGRAAGKPVMISFTPHLLPTQRGILATSYAKLTGDVTREQVLCAYAMYDDEPFVHVLQEGLPEVKHVAGSNNCNIGFVIDKRLSRIVVISVLDNIVKGASGQAIQNMNLMCGLPETTGLTAPAFYF